MKTIIAIDPGKSGGIAVFTIDETIELHKMPETEGDIKDILETVQLVADPVVYLEEVGGFIKGNPAPGSAMFNFGRNYGYLMGLCSGLSMPLQLVRPQRWQKELSIPTKGSATPAEHKRSLKAEAQRRHPDLKITLANCDALLILDWAMQQKENQL